MNQYLVTIEIIPAIPFGLEPFVETVDIKCNDSDELDENISGFPGSSIEKIMIAKNIDIVHDWKIIRTEDIAKPNTSKQPKPAVYGKCKPYDTIYGYWITDTGELIPVEDQCGHMQINMYGYKDGWIAVITQNEFELSFRFFENDVTVEALKSLLEIIRKSNYPVYYCNFGIGYHGSITIPSKVEVNQRIRNLMKEKE